MKESELATESAHQPRTKQAGPKVIDLFAGAGGLTLGLHNAGLELLFAVEKDSMAFETYCHNFLRPESPFFGGSAWPDWLSKSPHEITEFLSNEEYRIRLVDALGEVDLVCGGPPCQGFSVAGARNGLDQRNTLPLQYVEFVKLVKPRAVLMENVEGMARAFSSRPSEQSVPYVEWFKQELGDAGYDVHYEVLDASDYGVPQVRRRLFLFGLRKDLSSGPSSTTMFGLLPSIARAMRSELGLPTDRPTSVREAIDDLATGDAVASPDSPGFLAGTYGPIQSNYARLMRLGVAEKALPDSHRFTNHTEAMLKFIQLIQETQPPGRLSREFLRKVGTKKQKKVFLDPDEPSSTITTHPDEFIHYRDQRIITIREMARLQSFPDAFHFKGRHTINGDRRKYDAARVTQVGNAVPPLMAEAIGRAIVKVLQDIDEPSDFGDAGEPNGSSTQTLQPVLLSP